MRISLIGGLAVAVLTLSGAAAQQAPEQYDAWPVLRSTFPSTSGKCSNGKWRAFDGGATGTTGFRVFFKDGVFRGWPL